MKESYIEYLRECLQTKIDCFRVLRVIDDDEFGIEAVADFECFYLKMEWYKHQLRIDCSKNSKSWLAFSSLAKFLNLNYKVYMPIVGETKTADDLFLKQVSDVVDLLVVHGASIVGFFKDDHSDEKIEHLISVDGEYWRSHWAEMTMK